MHPSIRRSHPSRRAYLLSNVRQRSITAARPVITTRVLHYTSIWSMFDYLLYFWRFGFCRPSFESWCGIDRRRWLLQSLSDVWRERGVASCRDLSPLLYATESMPTRLLMAMTLKANHNLILTSRVYGVSRGVFVFLRRRRRSNDAATTLQRRRDTPITIRPIKYPLNKTLEPGN